MHADQMRLANLINDNSDDAEMQKKLDQVVELTSSTRDQAAVALHDCHYDVEKAVDMILEGDHAIVENQWKSAGKKKNKNNLSSQATKAGSQPGGSGHHPNASNKNVSSSNKANLPPSAVSSSGPTSVAHASSGSNHQSHHNQQQQQQPHHQQQQHTSRSANQANNIVGQQAASNQYQANSAKQDASDNLKNLVGISPASNLISSSDSTTTSSTAAAPIKSSSLQQQQPQQQRPQQAQRGGTGNRQQQHQRSTRIPDSAVEMPNNELQVSSLNVQFGELDLRDGGVGAADARGTFQDVLESNRQAGRQAGLPNSHSTMSAQDSKSNRPMPQHHLGKGGPRRQYNNSNNNDDRRVYNNSNRGGRQISGNQRPYNQRPSGPMNNNNSRGIRTILNRGLQPNPTLAGSGSNQASNSGFPNSIDTWTNSTAEVSNNKSSNAEQTIGVGGLRVGQWSDVAGNEDWSEEDWEAKVMETKVFTPSSKAVDGAGAGQKNQSLLADTSVPSQMNLASKLSDTVRDDVSSQQSTLNSVNQQGQQQQSSQKPISHMNDIFDASVAKAVLEQQNLASIKPKTSIGMGQYNKETSDAKNVLEQQNLSSMKPKPMSMNQYSKEASESLKSLVGITSAKGNVPSVPPGALPIMSQPQYIMGNAYQPAIFPYAYQTPDVHYQVAAQTAGRDQNFQSIYSPNDANKFNRGTDGDAPAITTTQAAPVASQTHNQAFVANALHAGYQLTYAMPGAFNMMPQNLYSAAPIFPHIPQPTNSGSTNSVYQKNTAASYQHHAGYSAYDQLNPLIQDYVKQQHQQQQQQQQQQNYPGSNMQQQQQQSTSKASLTNSELDVGNGGNAYNMYGSVKQNQQHSSKQTNYNDSKGYQQQMSGNGGQQQFGFSQQPSSIAGYPIHNLDSSNLSAQASAQQQLQQHSSGQRGGTQVNPSKYYPNWN